MEAFRFPVKDGLRTQESKIELHRMIMKRVVPQASEHHKRGLPEVAEV